MAAPGSNKPEVGDILVVIRKFVFSSSHSLTQSSLIKGHLFSPLALVCMSDDPTDGAT